MILNLALTLTLGLNFVECGDVKTPKPICLSDCVVETVIGPAIGLVFILSVCCLAIFLSHHTENHDSDLEFSKRDPDRRFIEEPEQPFSPLSDVQHTDPDGPLQSPESVPESIDIDEVPGGALPPPKWPIRQVVQDGRPAPSPKHFDDALPLYSPIQNRDQCIPQYHEVSYQKHDEQDKMQSISMHRELVDSFGIA